MLPMKKEKSIIKEKIEIPAGLAMVKGGTILNDNEDNDDAEW
jgi:hypothetical protein